MRWFPSNTLTAVDEGMEMVFGLIEIEVSHLTT